MIKFFRKIRKELLNEGKTTKYLKYAIGEVILVVIGILIALSVNNWNEIRKQRIEEIGLLRNLKTDFEIKTKQLQEEYEINKKLNANTIRFMMSQLNHQVETFDLKDYLYFGDYYPTSTHINSLEVALDGNSVNIFRSDSLVNMLRKLKVNLVNLEIDAAYMDETWSGSLVPFFEESGLEIHRFAFIHKGIKPDPEILKGIDMKVFANEVSNLASMQVLWLNKQKVIHEEMNNIIQLVQIELEK